MSNVNKYTRILIQSIAVLVFTFVWSNYYLRNFSHALIASIFATIIFEIILYLLSKHKNKINTNNALILSQLNAINNAFTFSSNSQNLTYYANIIKSKYCSQKYKDCIVAVNNFEKLCFIPIYYSDCITNNNVCKCIKIANEHKCTRLIILTNYSNSNIDEYCSNIVGLKVEIKDLQTTYNELICGNTPPQSNVQIKKNKLHFKDLLKVAFDKKRARGYLVCSIILLISSLFVPYNLYYVIMGSITLILALICQTKKV